MYVSRRTRCIYEKVVHSQSPHFFLASCIPRRASLDLTRITLHSHKRYTVLPFSSTKN